VTSPRFSRAGLAIDSFGLGQQFLELGDPRLVGEMGRKERGLLGADGVFAREGLPERDRLGRIVPGVGDVG
jgi:hypothetical protein